MPRLERSITVTVPASTVFALISDVDQAPRLSPSAVHNERLRSAEGEDVIRRWVVDGSSMRTWQVDRHFDPAAMTISFNRRSPAPPVTAMHGKWSFHEVSPEETVVELEHTWTVGGSAHGDGGEMAERFRRRVQTAIDEQLAELRRFLGHRERLLRFEHEDTRSLMLPCDPADAFAAAWQPKDPPLLEESEHFQVLGSAGAEIYRARVGESKIIWKQIHSLPPGYLSVRGVITFHPMGSGVEVRSSRIVSLDPDAVRADPV